MMKTLISFGIILFSLFFHSYNITTVPNGLYLDETSIALNAGNIAESGIDEYGNNFPVYFEAFGDWKNPLYIYVSAGIMKIFGISNFTLRVTSILFFGIFLWGIYLFTKEIFKNSKNRNCLLYFSLISASVTPWFFTLSRISFEVISQISTGIFVLYFLYKYYVSDIEESVQNNIQKKKESNIFGILSGVSFALFLYSYSTSKLIAFGILFALFFSFYEKKYWKKHRVVFFSFFILFLPYLYFSYSHAGALTARFELLTYLYNPNIEIFDKFIIFFKNYFSSYDISNFLLFEGDKNMRHSTGFMGQIFFATFIFFILGIYKILSDIFRNTNNTNNKNIEIKKYKLFLLILLLGAPISASLTTDFHHSLRLLFFGMILFIFSIFGFALLLEKYGNNKKNIFLGVMFMVFFQSYFYFSDYFDKNSGYAKRAIPWFDGNKFEEHIQISISESGDKVLFENPNNPFYANVNFYNLQHKNEKSVIMTKKYSIISDAKCVIVPQKNIQEFQKNFNKKSKKKNIVLKFKTSLFSTYCKSL